MEAVVLFSSPFKAAPFFSSEQVILSFEWFLPLFAAACPLPFAPESPGGVFSLQIL